MAILSAYLARARWAMVAPYVQGDVLDLGCGDAEPLRARPPGLGAYWGVERSEERVDSLSRLHPDAHFVRRDLERDHLAVEHVFDCVLMVAVVEHIYNRQFVMRQAAAALKPSGAIVITTPTPFGNNVVLRSGAALGLFAASAVRDHVVIYSRHGLEALARECGLRLQRHATFQFGCNQIAVLARA